MSDFIPNIDDANTRIAHLEGRLGLAASGFIPNIDEANERIAELERKAATGQGQSDAGASTSSLAPQSAPQLTGIRRAIAADGGGVIPAYGGAGKLQKGAGLARAIAAHQKQQEAK